MRHTSATVTLSKMLWATLLACCLQDTLVGVAADSANIKSREENLQMEGENSNVQQGWADLGLKGSNPSVVDQLGYYAPIVEKRAWQSLQGGWGKRYSPSDDDLTIQELAALLEQQDNQNLPRIDEATDFDIHDDEKRNWNRFSDGWGKRSKWDKFGSSWGKRDPAWSKLKGVWGKRSMLQNQFAN